MGVCTYTDSGLESACKGGGKNDRIVTHKASATLLD